jgi:hypothetical protein
LRVRVYIDGFNFYYGASNLADELQRETGERLSWKWLDIPRVCVAIASRHWPDAFLDKCYYFTAPVKQRWPGDRGGERQDVYLRALQRLGVEVVRGKLLITAEAKPILTDPRDPRSVAPGWPRQLVQVREEKGSDVNLAKALLVDHFTSDFDASVVVSNDSDLAGPVQYLREAGRPLGVINPHRKPTPQLWPKDLGKPHFGARLEVADLRGAALPDPLTIDGIVAVSKNGRPLTKPPTW